MKDQKKKKNLIVMIIVFAVVSFFTMLGIVLGGAKADSLGEIQSSDSVLSHVTESTETVKIEICNNNFAGGNTAFDIGSGVELTLENCKIVGSTSGAIYVKDGGVLNLINCEFNDCVFSDGNGAAINASSSTVKVYNSSFNNCSAYRGGAIYVSNGSEVKLSGETTIDNCSAYAGGGVYVSDDGSYTTKFELNDNSIISNCDASLNGGAIFASNGKVTVNGGEILSNTAVNGGAVFSLSAIITIDGGEHIGNVATENGGFLNQSGAKVTISGGYFCGDNIVGAVNGGFIYSYDADLTINNNAQISDFVSTYGAIYVTLDTKMSVEGGLIKGCKASSGGAIYVSDSRSSVVMSGGIFNSCSANSASGLGGSVFNQGTFKMTGGTIQGDGGEEPMVQAYRGGAIYNNAGTVDIEGGSFCANVASYSGGAIYNNNGTLNLKGGSFHYNYATSYAGAIWNERGTIVISGTNFKANMTVSGNGNGGAFYNNDGTITMTSGKIEGFYNENKVMSSVSKNGGAFYNSGGTVSIQGGSIEYCFTTSAGGAIYNSGNLIISGDVQFLNNKTNGYGGTIRNNGTLDMTGGTIDGSSTYFANRGGGVFNAGTFNMSAGTIKNYLGRQFGAGVYNTGTFNISGTALLTNNDSHPSYTIDGGNVYNSGTINMTGGNISNGNAKNGGNIFNEATLFISDGTISGGVASIDGGNIFNELSLEMTGGTVTNGVAVNGGGIYSDYYSGDAERMYISDVTIRDCTATKYGGGAYFFSYDLSLDSFDVSGCTAEYGGALYVVGDNSVCDVLIDDCVANTSGGGIYMGDPGGYIRGVITNSRAINGGGVFLNNNLYCYLEDVQISQCSAEFGGGVFSYSSSIRFYDNSTGFIKNNTATQGAGIYLDNATIHLEQTSGFVIGENTATLGGGLFVNGCDVNADKYSSLNIESNNAEKGAGIYVNENSTFSMTALKIVNNAAKDGNYGHGGGIYNAGVLYMNSGEILGDGATVNAYAGGGIYNTGSLDLFGGKISDCVASANGGGIYLEGGEITYHGTDFSIDLNLATLGGGLFVNGGVFGGQDNSNESAYLTISSNKAEKGAGVYVDNNVSLEIKDPIKILNNSATAGGVTNGLGGGIYNAGNLVMSAGEILGNSKTVNAYAGGGIYNAGTAALSGGKISGCVASTYGGGFDNAGEATFSGVEISACISEDRGGGCFVRKSSLLTIENETLISSNIAQKGGGVTIVSTGSMIMNGGMIAKNHLSIANNNGRGGQVYLQTDTSNFTMNGGTISGNDGEQSQFIPSVEDYNAYDGGGVYNNGTFTMNGGEILNCSGIRGGALYNVGTFNMYAANEPMIYSNFGRSGGAIYSVSSTLNLLGGYISVNYASNHGSAVYATGSTMEIDGTFIDDNCLTADNPSSTNAGHGTVTFSGGTAVMKSGSISNNRILSGAIQPYGGGVYVTGSAVFTVTGGSFEGNCIVADESSGGTFHVNSSATLNINGVTIKGDNDEIVATNGGAISNYGTVNIVDTYIEGCKSNVAGGAIMNWGTLTVSGLSLYGCSTTIGIGDSIATMGELRIDGNIVCQNLDVAVGSNNAEVNNFYDLRSTGNIVIASSMDIEKFNISFFSSDVSTTSYDDESGLYYGLDTTLFEVFDYFNIEEHPYSNALFVHYFKDFSYNNVIPLNEEMISFENGVSRDVFDFVLPAGFELVSHDDGGYFLGLETHLVIIVDSFGENLGQILATSFSSVHFIFNDNGFLDCIGYEDFSRQIYDEPIQTENDLYVTYEASGDTNRIIEDIEICLKVKEFSLKIINDASQQVLYEGTFLSGANVELTSSTVSVNEAVVCRTTDYEEDGYSFVADGVFYNQFGEYVTYTTILLNEDLILYAQYTRYECFVVNLNFMKQYYLGDGSLEFSDENLYNRESFVSLDAASIVINQGNVQLLRNGSEVIFEFAYDYYDDGYRVGNITISINGVSGQYTEGQTINIPSGGAGETINVDVLVNYEKEIWLQIFNSENGESLFENTYYGSVTVDLTYTKVSVNGVVVFEATYYESDGNYYVPTYGFTNTQGDDISNSTIVMYEDLKIIAQYYISIDEA